jgi:hypothetical protein
MAHGTADATGTDGTGMFLAERTFDETYAGLGELMISLPQRGGGEGDGGDFGGLHFYLGGFCVIGGFYDHLSSVFFENAGDLTSVVFFLSVVEV